MVSHVWERRLTGEVRGHHLRLHGLALWRGTVLVLFVFLVIAAIEVGGALVFVGSAMLGATSVSIWLGRGTAATHKMVPLDKLVHVGRGVLVQLLVRAEDEDGNIDGAEHGELVRLLKETALALEEGAVARYR